MLESPDEQTSNERPTTNIAYDVTEEGHVTLFISDSNFEFVRMIFDDELSPGSHSFTWDGTDYNGERVASGVYYYTIITENYANVNQMLLLR